MLASEVEREAVCVTVLLQGFCSVNIWHQHGYHFVNISPIREKIDTC